VCLANHDILEHFPRSSEVDDDRIVRQQERHRNGSVCRGLERGYRGSAYGDGIQF
jgi:hypothetical protein